MSRHDGTRFDAVRRSILEEANQLGRNPVFRQAAGASVLVTGASGMIGSALALSFLAADRHFGLGLNVYGMGRNMGRAERLYADTALRPLSRDVAAAMDDLPRFDYIIHAASPVGPTLFAAAPASVVGANLKGTINLLEKAARDGSGRFLFVSTHEVYGRGEAVWREEDAGVLDFLSSRACYPESKRAGENACVCFHRQYGVHTGIARLARVIGSTMNLDSGLFICDFIKDGLAGRPVAVKGNARLTRPLAFIADVTDGLIRILFQGEAGTAYNVAPLDAPSIGDAAREVAALAGVPVAELSPGGLDDGAVQDISRLRGLGWEPRTAWRTGIAKVWNTLRNVHGVAEE